MNALPHGATPTPLGEPPVLLEARGLTRRFGGLFANQDVSLSLQQGQIHAVIGPNGAGKSTLTNLLSGDLPPTSGTIVLNGQDVTGYSADDVSLRGLGRSYQKTNIFLFLTVEENIRLCAQSRLRHRPWNLRQWFDRPADDLQLSQRCTQAMELAGLTDHRDRVAAHCSHGVQRQLEIGMALATQPNVLLLDEPLAGMGVAEAEHMTALLLRLKPHYAMMLVEHDMDAVFSLADRLTVLVNGKVIAQGEPSSVRADSTVQAAYLGEEQQ